MKKATKKPVKKVVKRAQEPSRKKPVGKAAATQKKDAPEAKVEAAEPTLEELRSRLEEDERTIRESQEPAPAFVRCRYCGRSIPKPEDGSSFYQCSDCPGTGRPEFDPAGRRIA